MTVPLIQKITFSVSTYRPATVQADELSNGALGGRIIKGFAGLTNPVHGVKTGKRRCIR